MCVCENFKYRKCTLLQKMCTGDYTCVCMPVYERMLHFTLPTNQRELIQLILIDLSRTHCLLIEPSSTNSWTAIQRALQWLCRCPVFMSRAIPSVLHVLTTCHMDFKLLTVLVHCRLCSPMERYPNVCIQVPDSSQYWGKRDSCPY